jgi:uncharacterized protein (DUF779 family)
MTIPAQVEATPAALALIESLQRKHGPLMFHQSGGCCDGSSPMCYPRGDFLVGDRDVLMGTLADTPFYISRPQFEYWKHTQLILDVVPGRGGMFSPVRACSPATRSRSSARLVVFSPFNPS